MSDSNNSNNINISGSNRPSSNNGQNDSNRELVIEHRLDTTGLICPEPVMMLHKAVRKADSGETIEVLATDPATTRDIPNFCRHLGHTLVLQETLDDAPTYRYLVQKKKA